MQGFSLHAATAVAALRPATVEDRLSWTEDGKVRYRFRRPFRDGSTVIVLLAHLLDNSWPIEQIPTVRLLGPGGKAGAKLLEVRPTKAILLGQLRASRTTSLWLSYAAMVGAPPAIRRWMGLALTPQAGVALGLALVAAKRFPAERRVILPIAIASTVVFELLGPVLTRVALVRPGEA